METNLIIKGGEKELDLFFKAESYYNSVLAKMWDSGFYATPENWDFIREEPKKSHPHYIGLMDYLLEMRMKINQLINSRERKTAVQIFEYLNGKDDDLYVFWERRIKEMEEANQVGNAKFYKGYLNSFRNYKKSLRFSEIDYNFLNKFKLDKKKTCKNNSINIYLKSIQAIYNEGVRRGIFTPKNHINPFLGMKEKGEPTKDKYLLLEDLKKIINNPVKGDGEVII